jgi:hypothetical protein
MTDPNNKPTEYIPTASIELRCGNCSKFMGIISLEAKEGSEKTIALCEELSKHSEGMGILCDICSVTTQKYDNNQRIDNMK